MVIGITPQSSFDYRVEFLPEEKVAFHFVLSPERACDLANALAAALEGGELLLRLPVHVSGQWSMYWKVREADSRSLFAHPEKEEWVATIGLQRAIFEEMVTRLRRAESFRLDSLCILTGFSNLQLTFGVS